MQTLSCNKSINEPVIAMTCRYLYLSIETVEARKVARIRVLNLFYLSQRQPKGKSPR
jgi:hypothetical protein